MVTMTAEIAKALRQPFETEEIGNKPKITCRDCSASPTKACKEHKRVRCDGCRNSITTAHMHISYVGHAETTDRLLQVDPEWTWEPVAWGPDGSPAVDSFGGMWIKLTVAGVTRIGYGSADGKRGSDAIKEVIGDAIRNAAMRFGVAIDLWGASHEAPPVEEEPKRRRRPKPDQPEGPAAQEPTPAAPPEERGKPELMVTQEDHKHMHALWRELGYGGPENRENRLNITARLLGLPELNSSAQLTHREAQLVIDRLRTRIEDLKEQAS